MVVHLVDHFRSSMSNKTGDQQVCDDTGWDMAGDPGKLRTFGELTDLMREINAAAVAGGEGKFAPGKPKQSAPTARMV
jgi:hypothetical protein